MSNMIETAIIIVIVFWVILIAIVTAFLINEHRKEKAQEDPTQPSITDSSVPMYGGLRIGFKPKMRRSNRPLWETTVGVMSNTPDTSAKPDSHEGFFDWLFS